MRIQLDRGDKTVDLEHNLDVYKTAERDEIFFDLLKKSLLALGYNELEMMVYISGANKKVKEE